MITSEMTLQIRTAEPGDFLRVEEFYSSLIDEMQNAEFKPGWEKVYTSMGFTCLDTISMYYEDTGCTEFKVFEYVQQPE